MMASSTSPEWRTVFAYSRCAGARGVSSNSEVMPITPFMGVRISWLMAARKSDLARDAFRAASSLSRTFANCCALWMAKAAWATKL